jgi:hypothetical protein
MKTHILAALRSLALAGLLAPLAGCSGEISGPPVTKAASTATNEPPAAKTNAVEAAEVPSQTVPIQTPALPAGVKDVVNLAQARVGDAVLLEYVKHATNAYELSAEDIVYLTDLGVSDAVLAAMIRRGNELREQPQTAATTALAANPAPVAAPPAPAEPAPQPAPGAEDAAPDQAVAEAPVPAAPVQVIQAQPVEAPAPQVQYVVTPQPQVTYNYFYQSLAPYGTWVEMPGYGWGWQPSCAVVDVSWQPYSHRGHWVYSDWGWYWLSDYSWGWAPFHYGRWHRSSHLGWVWFPGSQWGPAWVTWRTTPTHCGWAPLPPAAGWHADLGLTHHGAAVSAGFGFGLGSDAYVFVGYGHLLDRGFRRHVLPRHELAQTYGRSTVINNIVINNQNTIINHGVPTDRIKAVTRQEVRKVQVRDLANAPGTPGGPRRIEQLQHDGSTLAVFRPTPPADLRGSGPRLPSPLAVPRRSEQEARPVAIGTSGGVRVSSGPVLPASRLAAEAPSRQPPPVRTLPESNTPRVESAAQSAPPVRTYAPLVPRSPLVSTRPAQPQPNSRVATQTPTTPTPVETLRGSQLPAQAPPNRTFTTTPSTGARSFEPSRGWVRPASPAPTALPSTPNRPTYEPATPRTPAWRPDSPAAPANRGLAGVGASPAPTWSRTETRKIESPTPQFTAPPKFANSPAFESRSSFAPSQPRSLPSGPAFGGSPAAPSRSVPAPAFSAPPPAARAPVISSQPIMRPAPSPGRTLQATPGADPRRPAGRP